MEIQIKKLTKYSIFVISSLLLIIFVSLQIWSLISSIDLNVDEVIYTLFATTLLMGKNIYKFKTKKLYIGGFVLLIVGLVLGIFKVNVIGEIILNFSFIVWAMAIFYSLLEIKR